MTDKLVGKTALITGAGQGIGRSIALKLASEGARIVVNDLDANTANETVEQIRWMNGSAAACVGSVTETGFAERFIEVAIREYQGLDILINNAGYTWDAVIQKMTDEQWSAMIDCHLTGPFRILRAAQPAIRSLSMRELEAGRRIVRKIVNVSSISGLFGNAGQVNYSAAKAGIVGLTQTLAKEWGRMNVTVNCVAFGLIKTRLTASAAAESHANIGGRDIKVGINPDLLATLERSIPLGRVGTPEEAAGAAYLFCIPESDYVSGQTLLCSGGLTGM
jgi:3-oxoacyl-[acyl-carrier protein] reductase